MRYYLSDSPALPSFKGIRTSSAIPKNFLHCQITEKLYSMDKRGSSHIVKALKFLLFLNVLLCLSAPNELLLTIHFSLSFTFLLNIFLPFLFVSLHFFYLTHALYFLYFLTYASYFCPGTAPSLIEQKSADVDYCNVTMSFG